MKKLISMKKTVILLSMFVGLSLFAQVETEKFSIPETSWVVGGRFDLDKFSTEKLEVDVGNEGLSMSLNINGGYAIKNNLLVGLGVNLRNSKQDSSGGVVKSNGVGFYPYIQKYFPLSKKIAFDLKAEVGYLYSESNNVGRKSTTTDYSLGIMPGLIFKFNDKFAVQTSIGGLSYRNSTSNFEDLKTTRNSLGLDLNLNLRDFNLGVLFIL